MSQISPRDHKELFLMEIGGALKTLNKQVHELVKMRAEILAVDGTTYGNRITLIVGKPVTQLDLIEGRHQNVPVDANLNLPLVAAAKLTIYNEGAGALYFDTNRGEGHLTTSSYLAPGESTDINLSKRGIKRLNLVASGNNTTVRVNIVI